MIMPSPCCHWNADIHPPQAIMEQSVKSGRAVESPSLSPSLALALINNSKAEMAQFRDTVMKAKQDCASFLAALPNFTGKEKADAIRVMRDNLEQRHQDLEQAVEVFAYVESARQWQGHGRLLSAHKKEYLAVFEESLALAQHVYTSMLDALGYMDSVSLHPAKLSSIIDEGFDIVPDHIDSFEDFDAWMKR
ncbi:TPA: hypothetical protein ACQVH3_005082 [Serratia marcescens]